MNPPLIVLVMAVPLFVVLVVALFNAVEGPRLSSAPKRHGKRPSASVLVPARNEEETLGACLQGLAAQDYSDFEVLVLDDGSTDRTRSVAERSAAANHRIRVLTGSPTPAGWSGKNWACHQLAREAQGDILIFTDADNTHHPAALGATVGWMEKHTLDMVSAFPQQIVHTLPEKLVVPVVDLFVYAFLPLWLTLLSRAPSLAAANGQWIAFTRQAYDRVGGHEAVRESVVEDVLLSRRAKKMGLRLLTLAGTGMVFGRMYATWSGVWRGFSKNLYVIAGGTPIGFLLVASALLALFVAPFALLFVPGWLPWAALLVALVLEIRLIVALFARQPILESVLLHPLGMLITLGIGFNSMLWHLRGEVAWKDRRFAVRTSPAGEGSR